MIVCEILFIVITIRIYKYSACTIAGNLSGKIFIMNNFLIWLRIKFYLIFR